MICNTGYACLGAVIDIETNITGPINNWVFVAVSSSATRLNFYINGVLSGTTLAACTAQNVVRNSNFIGRDNYGPISGFQTFYLDDLMFFNKGLAQSQIQSVMSLQTTF